MALDLGSEYQDLASLTGVRIDLRYASNHNFTGENLYAGSMTSAYLHVDASRKLAAAAEFLLRRKPKWSLLVFDALRPRSVQRRMWDVVKGTAQEIYVANPDPGSMHNFGLAVDLSIADEHAREIDMGTPFDSFEELAQPRLEEKFLMQGKLTLDQIENRHLLRSAMLESGFESIPFEWWHFNAIPFSEAQSKYKIIE